MHAGRDGRPRALAGPKAAFGCSMMDSHCKRVYKFVVGARGYGIRSPKRAYWASSQSVMSIRHQHAAATGATCSRCSCPGGDLNSLRSGSLTKHSTAVRGKMPSLWQVRATETGTEKTALPSAVESWWRTFLCRTAVSRIYSSAPLLWGGMPGYLRKVSRWGAAPSSLVLNLWPSG